ncbi:phosphopantetheine-binding protein [Rhodococcus qingshengii]|jgi:bifunctional isochorismate lyase/aryl carrier protein|uniref:Isochorismatase n=6 Tax=Rhodococcus TaxID=1827 RepID=A0A0C2ZUZ5_RHOER|nr:MULTISPECIES: phosphopantetheine-binding protein [Rhodococcus]EEN88070.1 phosphopantetheine attachment domain protein [Rhodococcus erythropolis SK121]ERB53080.1 isochorismatase [Rhodococcus sp. P27]MCD2157321.1 phosphopantetheine-binding protein [Rhodococcus cerastii]NHE63402.1 isochorismatase [Rhodococcus sp. D-46]NHP13050.1 isochorismatase [Rhodococcus sp. IC4_135]OCC19595.1 isochorismatase [Prescottella equi]|eukprot:gene25834-biopygen22290
MSNTVDRDQIVRDVAEVLSMRAEQLGDDADLGDEGLDSVRLMTLVERWRGAGADADFAELAEEPTINAWVQVLCPQ